MTTTTNPIGAKALAELSDEDCLPSPPQPDPHKEPLSGLFKIAQIANGTTPVDIRRARRFADECIDMARRRVPFSPDSESSFLIALFVENEWHHCQFVRTMCEEVLRIYAEIGLVDVNEHMDVFDKHLRAIKGKQLPLKRAILRGNMVAAEALITVGGDVHQIVPGKDWVEFVRRYAGHHSQSREWLSPEVRCAAADHLRKMSDRPETVEISLVVSNPPLSESEAYLKTFQDLLDIVAIDNPYSGDLLVWSGDVESDAVQRAEELKISCICYLRSGVNMPDPGTRYFVMRAVAKIKLDDAFSSTMHELYQAYIDAGALDVNWLYDAFDTIIEGDPLPSLLATTIRLANLDNAVFLVEHGAQLLPEEGDLSAFTLASFPVGEGSRPAAAARLVQARMTFSIQQHGKGQSSGLSGADASPDDSTLTSPADSAVTLGPKKSTPARRAL
ncbi:hypothetical protein ABIC83_002738 [Roseateles asaccharophilus]|uniref:hypothetical protein n=1 Tax=Roseateles asaccharophilus TaxID=582607 RepID=UPI00383465DB